MSSATLEKTQAPSVRVLGKTIRLGADYDPAGKDKNTVIRTTVPFTMKSLNDEERSIEFIGSTATADRYGDVIVQAGWEIGNFTKNPVVPWGHNYSEPPVAQATEVGLRDGNLFFKAKFATAEEYPFADTIYKLYKGGYLRAFSVGFIPLEYSGNWEDGYVFTKCELLEVSCVTVPANPEALTLAFREGVVTDTERRTMVKQAEKLILSLTETPATKDNEDMSEETKAYIDEKFKGVLDAIAELRDAEAPEQPGTPEEPAPVAEPPAEAGGGTTPGGEEDEPTEEEVRAMVRGGLSDALGIIE